VSPSDADAYAAMQANPEVMRYLVTGRTSTRAEVWRTMATSLGAWALRGYGMWACEKIDDDAFVGSVGIFEPLDRPEPGIAYSLDQESGSHMTRWWRGESRANSSLESGVQGLIFGILFPPLTRARAREGSDENPAAVGRSAAAANSC
jgi:hypothetical protein